MIIETFKSDVVTNKGTGLVIPTVASALKINSIEGKSVRNGTPTPEAKVDINSVRVKTVKVNGKNNINFPNFTLTAGTGDNYKWKANVVTTKLKPNTEYTLSFYSDFTKTGISAMFANNSNGSKVGVNMFKKLSNGRWINTFTTPSDVTNYSYLLIYAGQQGATSGNTVNAWDIQIERGSVATPFESYKENKFTLSAPVTLRSLGNVKDTMCIQGNTLGVLRRIYNDTYKGESNETWYKPTAANAYRIINSLTNVPANNNTVTNAICSHFIPDTINKIYNTSLNMNGMFGIGTSGEIVFRKDDVSTLDAWKTWLQSNNVTVQGVLKTPVFEPLPDADQNVFNSLRSYDGVTVITTDSSIEPEICVTNAVSLTGAYVLESVNALGGCYFKREGDKFYIGYDDGTTVTETEV